jgi:hypothetical protein
MRRAIPPLPNTPSWRGAQLKHRDDLNLNFKSGYGRHVALRLLTKAHHCYAEACKFGPTVFMSHFASLEQSTSLRGSPSSACGRVL